jgi:hypothetical protein
MQRAIFSRAIQDSGSVFFADPIFWRPAFSYANQNWTLVSVLRDKLRALIQLVKRDDLGI